ncbi:MAG: hypothetical protein WCI74_09290 [Actinomycetes bacterium]
MKRTLALASAVLVFGGLAACGSSTSSTPPLTIAQTCPQVEAAITADLAATTSAPTADQLNKAASDINAIKDKSASEAQALVGPLATALQGLAKNPTSVTQQTSAEFTAWMDAANAYDKACTAAGAPLGGSSASPSASASASKAP